MSNRLLAKKLHVTTVRQAKALTGGLSEPTKMPGFGYSLPAWMCPVGSKLRQVEGSVCHGCYALKGRYVFPRTKNAMTRRLASLNHPLWVEAMAFQINHYADRYPHFRWHDSGDLQNEVHLDLIVEVCKRTPTVKHWLPTREIALVKRYLQTKTFPKNLIVRVSAPMVGEAIAGIPGVPVSTVGKADFGVQCTAREHGGKCNECRACWSTANINYYEH